MTVTCKYAVRLRDGVGDGEPDGVPMPVTLAPETLRGGDGGAPVVGDCVGDCVSDRVRVRVTVAVGVGVGFGGPRRLTGGRSCWCCCCSCGCHHTSESRVPFDV